MRIFTTISYPRSGSHFVREAMSKYYGYSFVSSGDRHGKTLYNIRQEEFEWFKNRNCVYVLRDPRDVMVSSYDWLFMFKGYFLESYIDGLSFSDFLRGKAKFKFRHTHKDYESFVYCLWQEPIKYWVEHTEWLGENWLYSVVRYEIAINWWSIEKLLMPGEKSKGIAGRWREYFSDRDLEYLLSIAGDRMKELGFL